MTVQSHPRGNSAAEGDTILHCSVGRNPFALYFRASIVRLMFSLAKKKRRKKKPRTLFKKMFAKTMRKKMRMPRLLNQGGAIILSFPLNDTKQATQVGRGQSAVLKSLTLKCEDSCRSGHFPNRRNTWITCCNLSRPIIWHENRTFSLWLLSS